MVGKPQLVSGPLDNLPAQKLGNCASFKDLTRKEESLFIYSQTGCLVAILALSLSGYKCLGHHLYLSKAELGLSLSSHVFVIICPDTFALKITPDSIF